MTTLLTRKNFVKSSVAFITSIALPGAASARQSDKPAPLKPELVKEFVSVAHGNLGRVQEMLESEHLLLHANWDWGGGDFESAIEAAGHVGNKDIANYLLAKGARYNIYLACMLGHLEVVRQVLGVHPHLLNSKGPHGFTILHHAQRGEADAVVAYLKSLGAKDAQVDFYAKA